MEDPEPILERHLARPQVLDPCLEIYDSAGDLDRVGGLVHDLRRRAGDAPEQIEHLLPAVDRHPICDRRDRAVVDVLGLRGADIAAHAADTVTGREERRRDVGDLQLDRAGADDLGVVDEVADLVGSRRRARGGARRGCGLTATELVGWRDRIPDRGQPLARRAATGDDSQKRHEKKESSDDR